MLRTIVVSVLAVAYLIHTIGCPPVLPDAKQNEPKFDENQHHTANDTVENDPVLQLEYHRYLKEVVSVLETDPAFKQLIENASVHDIKSGKIASHLELVHHQIRTKLDELKRKEIERLRNLISRKAKLNNLQAHDIQNLLPKHINHENVETFEVGDLEKLIRQATLDLEEVDKLRREEFKEHEIEKEFERRRHLQDMDAEARKKAEQEHIRNLEAQRHHARVNHPGSKDQLKEVWEEQDHLETEKFDPKTFFKLHDTDGNNYLDQYEIEALFQIELDKIFNASSPEYDPAEREEEANRMREHVFSEIDKNRDKMISMEEFLHATESKDFEKNEEWKDVEDEQQFNDEEFQNYSRAHMPVTQPTPVHHAAPEQHQQAQHHEPPQGAINQQHQQQQQAPPHHA